MILLYAQKKVHYPSSDKKTLYDEFPNYLTGSILRCDPVPQPNFLIPSEVCIFACPSRHLIHSLYSNLHIQKSYPSSFTQIKSHFLWKANVKCKHAPTGSAHSGSYYDNLCLSFTNEHYYVCTLPL